MDTPADLLSALIAALSLTPAEGATEVTPEQILAKINELTTAAGTAAETGTTLAAAQAELETVRTQYQELFAREESARKQVEEAAATTPEAKARLRTLLLNDKDSAVEILNGLPAAAAAPKTEEPPPEPMHKKDGEETTEVTPEAKIAEANALIAALQKSGKPAFKTYDAARNEIRRQRPELFS